MQSCTMHDSMHHWLWDDHVHQVLWINMDIHHSKHVYNQSNPCGTPPMTFEHDLSKRHFGQISCICLPNPNNSIEMCSKWPKAMIDCDQGQIGVI